MIKSSPSPLTTDKKLVIKGMKIMSPDASYIETPVTALDRRDVAQGPLYKTIAKRLGAIAGGLKRYRRSSSLFGRRLSRRIQEIYTPTSGETTSSALSTPAVAKNKSKTRLMVASSSATTSGGANENPLIQKRLQKKLKKEKGSRPSLHLRGNIFAKYRTSNKGAISDFHRQKSRKQRMEHFNVGRDIDSLQALENTAPFEDNTISSNTEKEIISDMKSNHCATASRHKFLGETVVIGKCVSKKKEFVEDTFTFGEEQFEYPKEFNNNRETANYIEGNNKEKVRDGSKSPAKYEQKLITTQDLEDFDRYITNVKEPEKDFLAAGSSEHFEQILLETGSNAPFEIKYVQSNTKKNSSSNSPRSSFSTHSAQSSPKSSQMDSDFNSITTATPHLSPISSSKCHLSRTIYGGTIIYNHRLPNINTTYVRKSSIYIKNGKKSSKSYAQLDSSSCNDVVLITNQTITFVDIMRMWSQMDSSTRIIVSFAVLASVTTLLSLFISLCSRR